MSSGIERHSAFKYSGWVTLLQNCSLDENASGLFSACVKLIKMKHKIFFENLIKLTFNQKVYFHQCSSWSKSLWLQYESTWLVILVIVLLLLGACIGQDVCEDLVPAGGVAPQHRVPVGGAPARAHHAAVVAREGEAGPRMLLLISTPTIDTDTDDAK